MGKIVVVSEAVDIIPPLEGVEIRGIEGDFPLYKVFHTSVYEEICSGCRLCENACTSLSFDEVKRVMRVNENSCKGCGTCVAICPSSALRQVFSDAMIFNALEGMEKGGQETNSFSPFYCHYCPISVVSPSKEYPAEERVIRLICSGWLDSSFVLESFEKGVAGVLVIDCFLGMSDSQRKEKIEREMEELRELMNIMGISEKRVRLEWISPFDGKFKRVLKEFYEELKREGEER
ncbi:MAG: hydrogenase iron-sulfur subunit [Candidatus Methanospirareceae archaeon]